MSNLIDPEGTEILHLENAGNFASRHVLEIGCGDGRLTERYAHLTRHVTAIDLDEEALQSAKKSCSDSLSKIVMFARADSIHLPFPHDTFDIALLAWSL